tara:strand:- start:381 stop:1145 length:765 start_codon:yes stop_codon:yes gene_type:complete
MVDINKLLSVKNKLSNNELTIGSWLQIPSPVSAEILASSDSFDWICVDLEHSSIDLQTCENMFRAIEQAGSLPIVRLSDNDSVQIKRVLDSGAGGIIVPMIKDLASLSFAWEAIHYPPIGKRGVGLARAQEWGRAFDSYQEFEKNLLLIAQIEHIEAVENIDQIFSSGLMDAFIVGPYDLSASIGCPGDFNNSTFKEALKVIESAAKKNNIPSGFHLVDPNKERLRELINEGYVFIAYSMDTTMLRDSGTLDVK